MGNMTYEVAVSKLRVLYELGLGDVRVNLDVWDAYKGGVKTVERIAANGPAPIEDFLMFRDMIVRPPVR